MLSGYRMHAQAFHFDFDCEVFEKAAPDGKERRIGGIVSTDHLDRQQEQLLQEGLDFSPFLKSGWFNDNHSKETDSVVGYPEKCEMRTLPDGRKGWYVEGYLLKTERANKLWELANELQRSGSGRNLGFSVEGSILERDTDNPKKVKKAMVWEVAVTKCPVNDKTALNVLAKSLAVGHGGSGSGSGVPGSAGPVSQESLEANPSPRPSPEDDDEDTKKRKKKKRKKVSKSEAVALLKSKRPGMPDALAQRIADYAIQWHPATGGTHE